MHPDKLSQILAIEEQRIDGLPQANHGDPTFLPISLIGGIGDAILSIASLRRLQAENYSLMVYSQHAKALRYFLKDIDVHDGPVPNFTWHLQLDSIARFHFTPSFGGFLMLEHKELFLQSQAIMQKHPDLAYLIQNYPKYKYALTSRAEKLGLNATTLPFYCLGFDVHHDT